MKTAEPNKYVGASYKPYLEPAVEFSFNNVLAPSGSLDIYVRTQSDRDYALESLEKNAVYSAITISVKNAGIYAASMVVDMLILY